MPESLIGPAISAGGSLLGGLIGGNAAEDAADSSNRAIAEAKALDREYAEKARQDALALYNPALSDFSKSMGMSLDELQAGKGEIYDILRGSNSDANRVLSQTGGNVRNAIMGLPTSPIDFSTTGSWDTAPSTGREGSTTGGNLAPSASSTTLPSLPPEIMGDPRLNTPPPGDYLLPTGVTRESFADILNGAQGMDVNSRTGAQFTPEDQWRIAAQNAQTIAETTARKNMGLSGRDAFDMGESRGVGSNAVLFPTWQQQTFQPAQPQQPQQPTGPTQATLDLASIANPISYGG